VLDFLKKLFSGDEVSSREQANNRLRLVLTHDRIGSSPQLMELLQEEIIEVIARHVDIDGKPEVKFITEGKHTALDINIRLKGR